MSTPIEVVNKQSRQDRSSDPSRLLHRHLKEQLEEHPYRTLAVAAGLGFVLGGGMLGRVTGQLVATGLRLGIAAMVAPIATQLVEQIRGEHPQ
jgi:hypothetical protein